MQWQKIILEGPGTRMCPVDFGCHLLLTEKEDEGMCSWCHLDPYSGDTREACMAFSFLLFKTTNHIIKKFHMIIDSL